MKNKYEIRGETTAIFLNRRNGDILETLIDTADLDKAKRFPNTWCAAWSDDTQSFYCYGKLYFPNKAIIIKLHRWLTNCPKGLEVDHYNNDTLDNRRSKNLRIANHNENQQNRFNACRNSKSGIRGVWLHKGHKKWQAQIRLNNKIKHLGYFDSIKDAETAVKRARSIYMPFSKEASLWNI